MFATFALAGSFKLGMPRVDKVVLGTDLPSREAVDELCVAAGYP
ncbi:hypothetical protein A6302_04368 [Methylobrevis pamukkalensis]|uniref:Uncharacterized protein n=1 Tax=Methylobrevis pamukkalensis TaxID=1439726 RepID=A0A1E3GW91_9HYPH|nr:hypothetical protein A6302_04368 [Methylobrevis pamukkalensis]